MKETLSGILGEGAANILLFILLFAAILVAIFIIYAILKRISVRSGQVVYHHSHHEPSSRLAVVDAAIVDEQRKLVLVRRDDVEHLILIGGPGDVVVEQNITADHGYAHSSRITEDQIARYQKNTGQDFRNELNLPFPGQSPYSTSSTLPLHNVSEPAPVTNIQEPVFTPRPTQEAVVRPPVQQAAPNSLSSTAQDMSNAAAQKIPAASPIVPSAKPASSAPAAAPIIKPVVSQSRTGMSSASGTKPTVRSHPAYPLSQVSQGVLTSTSAAVAAANASSSRSDHAIAQNPASLDDVKPVSRPPLLAPQASKAEPLDSLNKADEFALLDEALDQALFNDLNTELNEPVKPLAKQADADMAVMLEEELLSSLDINANGDLSIDIEDEMEKLLGELSINPER